MADILADIEKREKMQELESKRLIEKKKYEAIVGKKKRLED